jgi:hypothetical protein
MAQPYEFIDAVERGLAAGPPKSLMGTPSKKPTPSKKEEGLALLRSLEDDINKTFGPAGAMGLGLYREGKGVDFTIGEDGKPMVTMLGDKDSRFLIDGTEVEGAEVLRKLISK